MADVCSGPSGRGFIVYDSRRPSTAISPNSKSLLPSRTDIDAECQRRWSAHRASTAIFDANHRDYTKTFVKHHDHTKYLTMILGEVEHYHRVVVPRRSFTRQHQHQDPLNAASERFSIRDGLPLPPAVACRLTRRESARKRLMSSYPSSWTPEVVQYLQWMKSDITTLMAVPSAGARVERNLYLFFALNDNNAEPLRDPYSTLLGLISQTHLFSDEFLPRANQAMRYGEESAKSHRKDDTM